MPLSWARTSTRRIGLPAPPTPVHADKGHNPANWSRSVVEDPRRCAPRETLSPSTVRERAHLTDAIVKGMLGAVSDDGENNRKADVAQAEYYRHELSGIRAQAEADLARKYIEVQQCQASGLDDRAADARRVIRALEREIITLERLGEGLRRWL